MQNNINVGSENASKITDIHGGSGVVSKINKSKVVPVFAVMVLPKYDVIDLVKMLAVNKSAYHPVMRLASGDGVSLELVVRGDTKEQRVEVFGYSSTGPAGKLMSLPMIGAHIGDLTDATDFVNHLPDDDITLQSTLNDVLRHDYCFSAMPFYLDEGISNALADSLRNIDSRIIQLYDNAFSEAETYWDISKLMMIINGACKHLDQLDSVGEMALAWINSVHCHNGQNVPFRRTVDGRDNPLYTLDYDGCITWFDIVDESNHETGLSVADLRRIRDEVWLQNFWHLTKRALDHRIAVTAAEARGERIGAVFILEEYVDALVELPFIRDALPRGNHRIKGVCITHPNGQTEYHQIRRKGIYADQAFSIITASNLPNLLLACPGASLATMVANGLMFGHSTVSAFTF